MSSQCNGNCSSCSQSDCNDRKSLLAPENAGSRVKKVIGIVSGKGGVGKSLVTSMLAVHTARKGYKVGILDADITGPSIPQIFGVNEKIKGDNVNIFPEETSGGIKIVSVNLLLPKADQPVIWRGPVIANMVTQFWSNTSWGDVDYMFVDMPPGTGDVPLTVFQALPVDGIVIVSSPQDLVQLIVKKAYNMAKMMNIPVLGLVENMSYLTCPDCDKKIHLFGEGKTKAAAEELGVDMLANIPIDPSLAELCDKGEFEKMQDMNLADAIDLIIEKTNNK